MPRAAALMLVDKLYNWLATLPPPAGERILGAGLARAEPLWAERIVRQLVARPNPESWAALLGVYSRLPREIRLAVHQSRTNFDEGLPIAARSADANARYNALLALDTQPRSRLLYVASSALVDPVVKIRSVAGRVLRKSAENAVQVLAAPPEGASEAQLAQLRREVTLAMEEAVRTYELHHRLEVLQAALWFAKDIGDLIWNRLLQPRSRAATAVWEYLKTWGHAPLAWFLLSALRHTRWRGPAAKVLRTWSAPAEVTAVLRESALLDQAGLAEHWASIHSPLWFRERAADLADLPEDVRALAPRWVLRVGFTEDERLTHLATWSHSRDRALQTAAIQALLQVRSPDVPKILRTIEDPPTELIEVIEQRLRGEGAATVRRRPAGGHEPASASVSAGAAGDPPAGEPAEQPGEEIAELLEQANGLVYAQLREACQAASDATRVQILELMRRHAGAWRDAIAADLSGGDPRGRLFALQLVSVPELAPHFAAALERMRGDASPSLRKLAAALCDRVRGLPAGKLSRAVLRGDDLDRLELLDAALTRLVAGGSDALERVAELLDELYPAGRVLEATA